MVLSDAFLHATVGDVCMQQSCLIQLVRLLRPASNVLQSIARLTSHSDILVRARALVLRRIHVK